MSWKRFSGPDVGDSPTPTRGMAADAFTGQPFIGLSRPRTRARYRKRMNAGTWSDWQDISDPGPVVLPDGAFAGDTAESEVEVLSGQPWRLTIRYVVEDDDSNFVSESIETEVFVPGNTYTLENSHSGSGSRVAADVMVDIPGPPL